MQRPERLESTDMNIGTEIRLTEVVYWKEYAEVRLAGAEDDECLTCPFLLPGKSVSPHDRSMDRSRHHVLDI